MVSTETAGQADVSWVPLRAEARRAADRAYRPYSGLGVGAAALVSGGNGGEGTRVVVGSNVENASYGLTLCAECSLVSDLVRTGGGRLVAVSVVDPGGRPLAPCGRCRQVLHEHGGPGLLVDGPEGPVTLGELLPSAFGPGDLP